MIRYLIALLALPILFVGFTIAASPIVLHAQAEPVTIAGCVQAGPGEGQFVLAADDKQTYQIQAADGVEVAAHLNHRVELTGTVEKTEAQSIFKASALKMVAASCTA